MFLSGCVREYSLWSSLSCDYYHMLISQDPSVQIKNVRIIQRLGENQAYASVASKYGHGYV